MAANTTVGVLSFVLLIILLALRIHVGIALLIAGFVGMMILTGPSGALKLLSIGPYAMISEYHWATLPFFVLMGMVIYYSGVTNGLFKAADMWLEKLPGGIALATTMSAAVFAAASGSSVAATAVFTKASLHEMIDRGYDKGLSAACVAAAGSLDILIPPSGLLVFYGIFTMQSIGKLLIAGFLPGIMLTALYMVMLWIRCSLNPTLAPKTGRVFSWRERWASLKNVWGVPVLFLMVIGGLFIGVFSATEAGAIGCFISFFIALAYRGLNKQRFGECLLETAKTTSMIFLILFGALIFGRCLALSRIPNLVVDSIQATGIPSIAILGIFIVMYLILGCFMEGIALLAVTLPVCFPVITAMGYDPVWFGIVMTISVEIAFLTPPVGLTVYVVKGIAGDIVTLEDIFRSVWYFVLMDIIALALVVAFPQIALFLPGFMRR